MTNLYNIKTTSPAGKIFYVIVRSWADGVIKLVKVGTLQLSEYEYKDVSFWFKVEKAFK